MKSVASGIGVAAALVVVFGSGSAGANPYDPYAGETYGNAVAAIGSSAVIATRVGEYLPTEQCIVTGSRNSNGKVLLDLNCNDTYAGKTGHSGNSAATPSGQAALKVRQTAKSLNEDLATATAQGSKSYCEENAQNCADFCQGNGAGLCSPELMQLLGL